MSYIGKIPTVGNFQVCDAISVVNNQAAYTMQVGSVNVSPESANHMIVSLNGVIQKPTDAFTVSGSTITFAANLVTGDVINFIQILGNVLDLGVPSDDTVTAAKLSSNAVTTVKILDANVTLAKLSATGTKNSTTFLRGDNTFAVAGSPSITDNGNATAITIDSSEQVGIGMSSPNARLSVEANGASISPMRINNTASGTGNNNSLIFQRAGTNVGLIGTTNNSTSYGTSSDYRLKENVDYTFDATTRLKQLKPARFNFISDADITVDGFIAHEVSSVVPEAIIGTKDAVNEDGTPDYQSIDQSKLVPLLVKTIQELEARITQLENA